MNIGNKLRIKYNGKIYVGEVIHIREIQNCKIFIIDTLLGKWLDEKNIIYHL